MLVHNSQAEVATRIHNAWLRTIEDGIHTYDIFTAGNSREQVGTREFVQAVIARLGQRPEHLSPVQYNPEPPAAARSVESPSTPSAAKQLVGVDIFLHWRERSPDLLGASLSPVNGDGASLLMISNRGTKVWPDGFPETFCADHWRCRFMADNGTMTNAQIIGLLQRIDQAGFESIKTENLYTFDGEPGYSLGQGQ